jgi:hypothetical protein
MLNGVKPGDFGVQSSQQGLTHFGTKPIVLFV